MPPRAAPRAIRASRPSSRACAFPSAPCAGAYIGLKPMIDLERVRADTPGVADVAHLNNAGASLQPRQVHEAVVDHLRRESEIGGYEAARERRARWEHTYDALARLINAERDEIAVVENATRAWDMAFYSFELGPRDRVLTGRAEYASNWIALKQVTHRTGDAHRRRAGRRARPDRRRGARADAGRATSSSSRSCTYRRRAGS